MRSRNWERRAALDAYRAGNLFGTDSTGMPRGGPKTRLFTKFNRCLNAFEVCSEKNMCVITMDYLITTQAKRNLSSRSGIGGVLSAT